MSSVFALRMAGQVRAVATGALGFLHEPRVRDTVFRGALRGEVDELGWTAPAWPPTGARAHVVRLAVVATHPIQYYAPLFRELAHDPRIELTVLYADRPTPAEQGVGFGVAFEWDVDLTSGYEIVWLANRAPRPRRGSFGDYDVPELSQHLAGGGYDVVLVLGWGAKAYWQAMRACWAHRIPLLVRGDSQLRDDAAPWKRLAKRVAYPWFLRRFAACLSVGQRSEEYFRYYGARRVVRSPHFVDNQLFAARAALAMARRDARRAQWGVAPGALALVFAGKLIERKRPCDLIRACHGIPGVHVLIVGDGPLRTECETVARRLAVPATFVGFLNQSAIAEAYVAGDALVLPSDRRETWGLVVNEAMVCGRPAIVSDASGCLPDLVVEGQTGYGYPAGDVGALSQCIERLVRTPRAAAVMGEHARARVAGYTVAAAAGGVVLASQVAAGREASP